MNERGLPQGIVESVEAAPVESPEDTARSMLVDPIKEQKGFMLHETGLFSLDPILANGILSIEDTKHQESGKRVKRLMPVGYSPVTQTINDRQHQISVYDQSLMPENEWASKLKKVSNVGLLISPGLNKISAKALRQKGWDGEALTTRVEPENIIGIVVKQELLDKSMEDLIDYYLDEDSEQQMLHLSKRIDYLMWAARAIIIESSRVMDDPQVDSDLNQDVITAKTGAVKSTGFIHADESKLREKAPLYSTIQTLASLIWQDEQFVVEMGEHIKKIDGIEAEAAKLEEKLAEYHQQGNWMAGQFEKFAQTQRDNIKMYLDMKNAGRQDQLRAQQDRARLRLAENKKQFAQVLAKLFRVYLNKTTQQDTSGWKFSDYLQYSAKKYAKPVYLSKEGMDELDVLWPAA
ncbi:MAG: hypothetical protein WCT32_00090 [Patescibacteria group bacterium]|jgi:hypothetical protein